MNGDEKVSFFAGFLIALCMAGLALTWYRDSMRKSAIDAGVARWVHIDKYDERSEFQWITNRPCN